MMPEAAFALDQTSNDVLGAAFSDQIVRSRLRAISIGSNALSRSHNPDWLDRIRVELNQLLDLPADWDSFGANPISRNALFTAYELIRQVATRDTPFPSIVPTSEGSVQVEWHVNGCDLEVLIMAQARVGVLFADNADETAAFEGELRFDLTPLKNAIARLSGGHYL